MAYLLFLIKNAKLAVLDTDTTMVAVFGEPHLKLAVFRAHRNLNLGL